MNESFVTIVGNMIGDPVVRTSKNGKHFATFRVASTTRRRDPATGGYVDGGTNYVNVVVFNGLAANATASLRKGEPVIVYGRLRVNQWVGSQNQHMTSVEVEAYTVGHDLTWGQTSFAKGGRGRYAAGRPPVYDGSPAGSRSDDGSPSHAGPSAAPVQFSSLEPGGSYPVNGSGAQAAGAEAGVGQAGGRGMSIGADAPPDPAHAGGGSGRPGGEEAPGSDRAGSPSVPSVAKATAGLGAPVDQAPPRDTRPDNASRQRKPGGFDRSVADAETDPYDVVTSA